MEPDSRLGDSGMIAILLREIRDLGGGNGFVREQNRDAVLNSVKSAAIAGDQRLAYRVRLRTAIGAPQTSVCDSAIDRFQSTRVQRQQWLMCDRTAKDVEQSFIHDVPYSIRAGRFPPDFVLPGRHLQYIFNDSEQIWMD